MKKILLIAFVLLTSVFFAQTPTAPVKDSSFLTRSLISFGIGFSNTQNIYTPVLNTVEQPDPARFKIETGMEPHSSKVINVEYDYFLFKHFSLGLSWSHQNFEFNYTRCWFNDSLITGKFDDKMALDNFGLKTTWYPLVTPRNQVYLGTRFSYMAWDIKSATFQPYSGKRQLQSGFRFQGIIGYHYFFSSNFGLTLEKTFGPPFFAQIGLNARF